MKKLFTFKYFDFTGKTLIPVLFSFLLLIPGVLSAQECTPPSFTATPGNIEVNNDAGECEADVTYTVTATGDPVPALYYEFRTAPGEVPFDTGSGTGSGSTFPVGVTYVTVIAENGCVPPITTDFTVTVADNETPVVSVVSYAPFVNDEGECGATISFERPEVTENCDYTLTARVREDFGDGTFGPFLSGFQNPDGYYPAGDYQIRWRATDPSGNFGMRNSSFSVVDTEDPVIVCPEGPITRNTDPGVCTFTPTGNLGFTTAPTDNCGIVYQAYRINSDDSGDWVEATTVAGVPFEKGTNTIEWLVRDEAGNEASCSYDVIVNDNEAPTVLCQNTEIELDETGNASITLTDISPEYVVNQTGTFAPVSGVGNEVILGDDEVSSALPIGFDFDFYGNTYSEFHISSNGFITFNFDWNSGCCSGQLLPNPSSPNNLIAFAWEDLDPRAESSRIDYFTTGTAPNRALVMNFIIVPHFFYIGSGSGFLVTSQVILHETTNIIEIHTTQMQSDGGSHTMGIENIDGTKATVVPGRNSSSWSVTNDYVAFIPNSGIFDNCGIASVEISQTSFDCSNLGENEVTVTATDESGNVSTCTSIVTVIDNIFPTIECPADITRDTDPGVCYAVIEDLGTPVTDDNCGVESVENDAPLDNIYPKGETIVTWTVTDAAGNTATCEQIITVEDNEAPVIEACGETFIVEMQPIRYWFWTYWQGYLNTEEILATISDNCDDVDNGLTVEFSQTLFVPNDWGENTETVTVTDAAGNTTGCEITVIVRYPLKSGLNNMFADTEMEDELQPLDINVYPNPTSGKLSLDILNLNNPKVSAAVYNLNGQLVFQNEFHTDGRISIDLTGNTSGMYLLRVVADEKIFNHKIILE